MPPGIRQILLPSNIKRLNEPKSTKQHWKTRIKIKSFLGAVVSLRVKTLFCGNIDFSKAFRGSLNYLAIVVAVLIVIDILWAVRVQHSTLASWERESRKRLKERFSVATSELSCVDHVYFWLSDMSGKKYEYHARNQGFERKPIQWTNVSF